VRPAAVDRSRSELAFAVDHQAPRGFGSA
jgi:hypothetical protein